MAYPSSIETLETGFTNETVSTFAHPEIHNVVDRIINSIQSQLEGGTHDVPAKLQQNGFVMADGPTGVAATDTNTIQSLINSNSGRVILLREGEYVVSTLTNSGYSGVTIRGAGNLRTTVKITSQSGGANIPVFTVASSGITFENVIWDGNYATIGSGNLWSGLIQIAAGISDVYFRKCRFQNTAKSAIYGNGDPSSRTVNDAVFNATTTVVSSTANFVAGDIGKRIVLYGAGPDNNDIFTTIVSVTNSTTAIVGTAPIISKSSAQISVAVSTTTPISRVFIIECEFVNIGLVTEGICIFLEQNINNLTVYNCRAYGTLSCNFIKQKGERVYSNDLVAFMNDIDYSATPATAYSPNKALGIECWNGSPRSTLVRNRVVGPNDSAADGVCWAFSLAYGPGSVCLANLVVKGGTSNRKIGYGIEVAECPDTVCIGNQVYGCNVGMNLTNNNPSPSHNVTINGNHFEDCYTDGIVTDSHPQSVNITNNQFIDCGPRFIFLNSVNTGGGDGTLRSGMIKNNFFIVKNQTRTDGENPAIVGVYIISPTQSVVTKLDIDGNFFEPHAAGIGTIGMIPIEVNNPRGVRISRNRMNGASPVTGTNGDWAIKGYCGDLEVSENEAVNFTAGFCFVQNVAGAPSNFRFNDIGTLSIAYNSSASTNLWVDSSGRLQFRNGLGTTTQLA